ncbi:hypothetical protein ND486_08995 [Pseudonocardia sp. DR1-2]|uniref:hypothetical protein n=1 Tax=Pseudonocardia sp. DR1-2 TaxID=2951168 RepID=UPI00204444EE|nr:hypothetical protein [Pseudonocardia sp. DR1-2]MCM3846327.1 hypothetical protein [Pseudonocardia sp. DR1-2]
MNTPPHPEPRAERPENGGATGAAVVGLARQVDDLTRRLDMLGPVNGRIDELTQVVAETAQVLATLAARRRPAAAPSWLLAPAEPEQVAQLLDELTEWLRRVFLRYPDGAAVVPECWAWHADVVEELLWLMHGWCAAYQGPDASVQLAGDWHDRQRPGVVNRLRKSVGSCSIEAHQTRPGWGAPPGAPAPVPGTRHTDLIVDWWATGREQTPPEPPTDDRVAQGSIGGALR